MTPADVLIFHIVGAALIAVGIIIFLISKAQGTITIKIFGQEVHLTTPSLLIFLTGVFLLIFPHTKLVDRVPAPAAKNESGDVTSIDTMSTNDAIEPVDGEITINDTMSDLNNAAGDTPGEPTDAPTVRRASDGGVIVDDRAEPTVNATANINNSTVIDQAWVDAVLARPMP